jgi:hypothetical protein
MSLWLVSSFGCGMFFAVCQPVVACVLFMLSWDEKDCLICCISLVYPRRSSIRGASLAGAAPGWPPSLQTQHVSVVIMTSARSIV